MTGAGIATFQTLLLGGTTGNAVLVAPRGTVDAGDAGIRVAGNLYVAALRVANADNIQVKGTALGVPQQASPNIGALTAASNTAGAAAAAASEATNRGGRSNNTDLPSIFTVEVIGYGGVDSRPPQDLREQDQRRNNRGGRSSQNDQTYDPTGTFRVIGNGNLTDEQKSKLTDEEKGHL